MPESGAGGCQTQVRTLRHAADPPACELKGPDLTAVPCCAHFTIFPSSASWVTCPGPWLRLHPALPSMPITCSVSSTIPLYLGRLPSLRSPQLTNALLDSLTALTAWTPYKSMQPTELVQPPAASLCSSAGTQLLFRTSSLAAPGVGEHRWGPHACCN